MAFLMVGRLPWISLAQSRQLSPKLLPKNRRPAVRRVAQGRRLDPQLAQSRLRRPADRQRARRSNLHEQSLQDMKVPLPERRLRGAVGERTGLPEGMPGE